MLRLSLQERIRLFKGRGRGGEERGRIKSQVENGPLPGLVIYSNLDCSLVTLIPL